MKTILMTLVLTALVLVIGAGAFIYAGVYDVSGATPHGAMSKWAMATTMRHSVKRRARAIDVPDLEQDALMLAGVSDFQAMCVDCHGAPGEKPGPMGRGLNPSAPDLQQAAAQRTPAELFWVTKHGIKMTGMPAWGVTHDDAALWPVVAFMTTLPGLDAEGYKDLLSKAEGMGHHVGEDGHDGHAHHAHDGGPPAAPPDPPHAEREHDHGAHAH